MSHENWGVITPLGGLDKSLIKIQHGDEFTTLIRHAKGSSLLVCGSVRVIPGRDTTIYCIVLSVTGVILNERARFGSFQNLGSNSFLFTSLIQILFAYKIGVFV